jgi:hypothetical protein
MVAVYRVLLFGDIRGIRLVPVLLGKVILAAVVAVAVDYLVLAAMLTEQLAGMVAMVAVVAAAEV